MHPKTISIQDYTYTLPEEKIAAHPLSVRDESKLLIAVTDTLQEDRYAQIANYITADSLMVFNNTKVVEARLLFQKPSGGKIEVFCLAPHEQYADITTAFRQTGKVLWQCLVGGASKWKPGQILQKELHINGEVITLSARFAEKRADVFIIELEWNAAGISFAEILHAAGAMPLPPYIKRVAEEEDKERYQTVYAREDGSVAAPTAGLHFTESVLENLRAKNIQQTFLTLHVGAGTFKPVSAEKMEDHLMHAEWVDIPISVIETIASYPAEKITAVGTTSMRSIESLYWFGVKIIRGEVTGAQMPLLTQWEPYETILQDIPAAESLHALMQWMKRQGHQRLITQTALLIAPGYRFRIAKNLVTNFHQPQSTLLLLVAALCGERWKKIYQYALEHDFRFLSYGDGCLLSGQA